MRCSIIIVIVISLKHDRKMKNIPLVNDFFSHIGEITTKPGRQICNQDLLDIDVLLVRSVTNVDKNLLQNTPVKFVASATSGVNHVKLSELNSLGIRFANALGSNANSVAQYVISAICYWCQQQDRNIHDVTVGIVGYGNVGQTLKKYCDMLGILTDINDAPLQDLNPQLLKFSSLPESLCCDVVSFHTPLTFDGKYSTYQFINKSTLKFLKNDALLINSSRGEVIDESALLNHKQQNEDIQLVLDVWNDEPNINLKLLENTLLATPHIAGYSYDGKVRGTKMIYQACCDYFGINRAEVVIDDAKFPKQIFVELNSSNSICKDVLSAYDIVSDSQKLQKILNHPELQSGEYFDSLRKNYPIRREWLY